MNPYVFIVRCLRSGTTLLRRMVNAHPQIAIPLARHNRDWRTEMSSEDVERFEAAADGLLNELSYSPAIPRSSLEALEHASSIPSVLAQDPQWTDSCWLAPLPLAKPRHSLEERCDRKPLAETEVE